MLSNHNKNSSSFRIIEPKQFQEAQQIPLNINHQQQIPIVSINKNDYNNINNSFSNNNNHHQQQQQQQQQQQHQHHAHHHQRTRNLSDTDSSYIPETTSESGISDLDMSEKCNCCPYGYHIDVDFVTFLQTLGGKNLNKQLKKIQRRRNERLQRSMEYVIDEVEKIRQLNSGVDYVDRCDGSPFSGVSPINPNVRLNSCDFDSCLHGTPQPTTSGRSVIIPPTLKKTIDKIDQQINEDHEIFNQSNGNLTEAARKLLLIERGKVAAAAVTASSVPSTPNHMGQFRNKSATSFNINSQYNTSYNHANSGNNISYVDANSNNFAHSSSVPPSQHRSNNHINYQQTHQHKNHQYNHQYQQAPPRRSYSSCAEPNNNFNSSFNNSFCGASSSHRRCMSTRTSPVRPTPYVQNYDYTNIQSNSQKLISDALKDSMRRSRSGTRRSKSKSKSPVEQYFRREIKINLSQPPPQRKPPSRPELCEEHHMLNSDEIETQTVTTVVKQQPPSTPTVSHQPVRNHHVISNSSLVTLNQTQDVQEEVLLNLFSCNNSGSISSESSESLVEFEECEKQNKLKINEVYQKSSIEESTKTESKRHLSQQHQLLLEKKLIELEKKLQKLPELEIKNNILAEEKQILIKQLLNMKQTQQTTTVTTATEPMKVFRSIGCNSNDIDLRRDVGTECKVSTRDVGINNKIEEPKHKEEIAQMQTIITTLRDKLNEQTIIMQQQAIKPQTRDVAIMHVVDKLEEQKPKPELRDVAINHRTESNEKELIEKHTLITNTYIKEIDQLRIENTKLTANLEELIKKHTKHVVTRGTNATPAPILYSVGTNTKKTTTRDVQVMFTPKSRDVSLCTDRFYHTRDVGLVCKIGIAEQEEQIKELLEIRRKYELLIEESIANKKSYRDVGTFCIMDFKEKRNVCLGCNLEPVKSTRDVALKCNLDEELKQVRHVCIGCQLDVKPEKRDASIFVNTFEPVIVEKRLIADSREFGCYVAMEDHEKSQMARELANLKLVEPKVTRDVGVSVDHRSRLMHDQLRNQSSSMEVVKTFNRQVNTETKQTRDTSCGSYYSENFLINKGCQIDDTTQSELSLKLREQKELIELERNKLVLLNTELKEKLRHLEEELYIEKRKVINLEEFAHEQKSKSQKSYISQGVGCFSVIEDDAANAEIFGNTESRCAENSSVYAVINRKESEFEQHKLTRTDQFSRTQQETVKVTTQVSSSNKPNDKIVEKNVWSVSTSIPMGSSLPIAAQPAQPVLRNEITIPICKDDAQFSQTASSSNKVTKSSELFVSNLSSSSYPTSVVSSKPPISPPRNQQMMTTSESKLVTELSNQSVSINESEKIVEKTEKKPKGILKSSSMPFSNQSSVSASSILGSKQADGSDVSSSTQEQTQQRKALTFGENEIVENFQSEQSGSDFSLDDNSQNNTIINNDDDEYLSTSVTYETPITTLEYMTSESATEGENIAGGQMKMERGNSFTNTRTTTSSMSGNNISQYDDYELQEKLVDSQQIIQKTSKHQVEEDANESNVKVQEVSSVISSSFLTSQSEQSTSKIESTTTTSTVQNNPPATPAGTAASASSLKSLTEEDNLSNSEFELELELHIACAILNDSLYEPLKADKVKVASALNLIQQDWFKLAAQKDSNPVLVEEHLNAFYARFSNLLLERIVNMADLNLNTALHYSVSTGNFEIVNLLLDTKVCDVNAQNKAGYTSIMLAAVVPIKNDYERMTLKRLFSEGNVNIKSTDSGQTALMLAVRHGNKDTVGLLLEAGSDCNSQDKEGSTALMAACEHGHIDIVRLLLDNTNCDPDIKDNDGETAFDISKNKNRNDIIVLLYAHSSKLRSHHPAIQFSKSRPRIGSAGSSSNRK